MLRNWKVYGWGLVLLVVIGLLGANVQAVWAGELPPDPDEFPAGDSEEEQEAPLMINVAEQTLLSEMESTGSEYIYLSGDWVQLNNFEANCAVTVEIPAFSLNTTTTVDGSGWGSVNISSFPSISAGDVVTASGCGASKSLTIPVLEITLVNQAAVKVFGTAAPSTSVFVRAYGNYYRTQTVTSDETGEWSADFSATPLTIMERVIASVIDADNDQYAITWEFSNINCTLNENIVSFNDFSSNTQLTVTIPAISYSGTVTTDGDGDASITLTERLSAGMTITATDGTYSKSLTLAALDITSVNKETRIIQGTGPANEDVQVWASETGSTYYGVSTTADGSGNWEIDFSSMFSTFEYPIWVDHDDADYDTTHLDYEPARIMIIPWSDELWVKSFLPEASVEITISALEYTDSVLTDNSGWASLFLPDGLTNGMVIQASDGVNTKTIEYYDVGFSSVTLSTDQVIGFGPANVAMELKIDSINRFVVMTDESGEFSVNTNSEYGIDIDENTYLELTYFDADEDEIYVQWVSFYMQFGWTNIYILYPLPGVDYLVEIPSLDFSEYAAPINDSEILVLEFEDYGIEPFPGMVFTVTEGDGTVKSMTHPGIRVSSFDFDADTMCGTALASQPFSISVVNATGYVDYQSVLPDESGNWCVDFSGDVSSEDTYTFHASYNNSSDNFYYNWTYPTVHYDTYGNWVEFNNFMPLETIQYTIDSISVSASVEADLNGHALIELDELSGYPVPPAGSVIAAEQDGDWQKTLELIAVDVVSVDADTDTVTGTGEAGEELVVIFVGTEGSYQEEVTINGSGTWTLVLSDGSAQEQFDIPADGGFRFIVLYYEDDKDYEGFTWQCIPVDFTVSPANSGTIDRSTLRGGECTQFGFDGYIGGSLIEQEATPASGYEFTDWSINELTYSNNPNIFEVWYMDFTVTANFSINLGTPTPRFPKNDYEITVGTTTFKWTAVDGVSGYEVAINRPDGGVYDTFVLGTDGCADDVCQYKLPYKLDVEYGSWSWKVRGVLGDSVGDWSSAATFNYAQLDVLDPNGPGDAAVVSTSTPTFTWSASTQNVFRYDLEIWRLDGTFAAAKSLAASAVCSDGTCTWTADAALSDGVYTWHVLGKKFPNNSGWSASAVFTVDTAGGASGWTGLDAGDAFSAPATKYPKNDREITTGTSLIKWGPVAGASSYVLELYNPAGNWYDAWEIDNSVCDETTCQYKLPYKLGTEFGIWSWRVRAKDGDSVGSWSSSATFNYIQVDLISVIAPVDGAEVGSTTPTLSWEDSTQGLFKYVVEIWTADGSLVATQALSPGAVCSEGTCSWTSTTSLSAGEEYKWRVLGKKWPNTTGWTEMEVFTIAD